MNKPGEINTTVKKDWSEFRGTGLALIVNQTLHIFGWALVFEMDGDEVKSVYPARVKFTGFAEKFTEEAYKKVRRFLLENAKELNNEAQPPEAYEFPHMQSGLPKYYAVMFDKFTCGGDRMVVIDRYNKIHRTKSDGSYKFYGFDGKADYWEDVTHFAQTVKVLTVATFLALTEEHFNHSSS